MIFILLYQCLAGFLAWFNYFLLEKKKVIKHWLNGALHIISSVLIGYYTSWHFGLSNLLFTRVVFDTVLNIFRNKGVGYVSPMPASWVDQAEKWMILKLAAIIYRKKRIISDEDIERVAILFRLLVLLTATILLFI